MPRYRVTRTTSRLETWDVEAATEEAALDAARGSGVFGGESVLSSVVALDTPRPLWLPSGFGVYCRRIPDGGESALLERMREAGAVWAALMVEASDGYVVPLERTKSYAEALRGAGLGVIVWTFPGPSRGNFEGSLSAAELVLTHARACGASAVLLDIEAPYKKEPEALSALIQTTKRGLPAGASLGVVSYPVPSWHATLNPASFALADWGSPMLYESAGDLNTIDRAYREWSALVQTIVPSLSAVGLGESGAEQLDSDIRRVLGQSAPARSNAAMVWSEQQMDAADRLVVRSSAGRFGWCAAQ